MSRDISYRSPQQLPQSRKPNVENIPPQRNTNDFIKQMKKRIDEPPLSIISQNSHIQEAKSIFIDVSRIDPNSNTSQNSIYDPQLLRQPILPSCHKSNQPSNCTTQRTNRYDQPSKPYLDQTDNASMFLIQQQMLQLQNENLILKNQLEKQESQRLLFQQQLLQQFQSQQNQQPIVINNNIAPSEKQTSKSIPPDNLEESYSPPKRLKRKKQQSQAIQTDKSVQDQSIIKVNDSKFYNFTNEEFRSQNKQPNNSQVQQKNCKQTQQTVESLTFGTQLSQRAFNNNEKPSQLSLNQPTKEDLFRDTYEIDSTKNNNDKSMQRRNSQFEIMNSQNQSFQQLGNYNPEVRKQSQPSVKMDFNFDDNASKQQKTLADCFQQRKKAIIQERKVSVQLPNQEEENNWIVNVKQRSKEEQIKLRKEMMEYGKNRRQQNGANKSQNPIEQSNQKEQVKRMQSPLMERLALGQKAKVYFFLFKVEVKEMFALTKKNYENLPEVKNKKNQEEMIKQKQTFMKERQNKLKELDEVNFNFIQKIKEKLKK